MPPRSPKCIHKHNQKNTKRHPLADGSKGDYYCQTCSMQWFSEDTVVWAVCKYFELARYTPKLAHQQKREGDIRVTDHLKTEEWIIEAKGQTPAGYEYTSFQEGLGQILMARARYKLSPHIIYALAMPFRDPFTQEAAQIDGKDRECLCLHWIWVKQVQTSHCTSYEVKIDCPSGSTCKCQKRIGTFSLW